MKPSQFQPPAAKPSLGLAVEVETASGRTYRWDGPASRAELRAMGLTFRTQRGDGFADGSCRLPRKITRDWPDLNLLDTIRFIGEDGQIDYEGRLQSNSRSTDDGHWIEVAFVGWMTHTRGRPFREIYIDKDLSHWQTVARGRKANLLAANWAVSDSSVEADPDAQIPALKTQLIDQWGSPLLPLCEAWYDAGPGRTLGRLDFDQVALNTVGGSWGVAIHHCDDLAGNGQGLLLNLAATASSSGSVTPTKRCLLIQLVYGASPAGSPGGLWARWWRRLAVFGPHGLPVRGTAPNQGLYASDVIRDIVSRFASKLNAKGVLDTTYPIQQIAFTEPTDPWDAFTYLNDHHNWLLAVWEHRTLHFHPPDLNDYDWQVRLDDPGVRVTLQGDSAETVANGVIVTYTDFAGETRTLDPDRHPELADPSDANPYNRQGESGWTKYTVPYPTIEGDALQIGRMALAEYNQPKAPGTIRVTGHIRDRAGNWQRASRVRAGETVAIMDHPNDRPRLIVDTTYNAAGRTLDMSVDRETKRLEPYLNRIETRRKAAGLGG